MPESNMQIDRILQVAVENGASDIHLHVGKKPTLRINGKFKALTTDTLTAADLEAIYKGIAPERVQANFADSHQEDFARTLEGVGSFRINVCAEFNGKAIVMRPLPKIRTMEDLRLPEIMYTMAQMQKGLVLVTGATGSGKSTTLAAMIDYINENFDKHIITVEDPIEFRHEHKKGIMTQREVGTHVNSFPQALEAAMREDPDVILIGEMRDEASVEAALRAAETGHLVFATLHSNTAATTVNRVVDFFPEGKQNHARGMLAACLVGVVSQTLLPTKDGQGRTAAREILVCHSGIKNLIRSQKVEQIPSQIQTGKPRGMVTMEQSLTALVSSNQIKATDAVQKLLEMDLRPGTELQRLASVEASHTSAEHIPTAD